MISNRQIRIFISSTFLDMQNEREMLIQRTLPRLRKVALERDVTLTFLDLRWGITEEEAKSGKVLEICLREIENSLPFFVGIIGDRYGWVPEKSLVDNDVLNQFNIVRDYLDRQISVTEIEMRFGVLERNEMLHANFYIKEQGNADHDSQSKLMALKETVKNSGYPVSYYSSAEDLARKFEQAFINLLDELYPNKGISEFEKEQVGHRALVNQFCQYYIKDNQYFNAIDNWLADRNSCRMVISGPCGIGKSALLANWIKMKQEDSQKTYNIIYMFPASTAKGSSHVHIMNYLISNINDLYGWDNNHDIDVTPDEILAELFIRIASSEVKPLLIIIDAINQIRDVDDAKLLNWLPESNEKIKILLSTRDDDRSMENFTNRRYPELKINPLSIDERKDLVVGYLGLFGKKLSDEHVNRIVHDKLVENTLILKTLLNELINFGRHEQLNEKINSYLSKNSPEEFYNVLLQHYEEHFGVEFVKEILLLILVARDGLSEDEILILSECKPLHWSQFYCSMLSHLSNKAGYISFSNTHLRDTVKSIYSSDSVSVESARNKIIEFFLNQETPRAWEELAYQYMAKEDIHLLGELFKRPQVMTYFVLEAPLKAWGYLQEIISNDANFDLLIVLNHLEGDFQKLVKYALFISQFTEQEDRALALMKKARECMREEDKAYFFHAMGFIYKEKSNEFFRRELSCLESLGLKETEAFADAVICVAKTNDLIGRTEIFEVESEEEAIALQESIRQNEISRSITEEADKANLLMNTDPQIYHDHEHTPEYHFKFEEELQGDELQLAYVTEAISIIKKLDIDKHHKIASYNSYLLDVLWLSLPVEFLPQMEDALEYYTFYKTRKCSEVAHILKQISCALTQELFHNDFENVLVNGKYIGIDDVDSICLETIEITNYIYGQYSVECAEAWEQYADFCDACSNFSKELSCYQQVYNIYDNLNLQKRRDHAKMIIDSYLVPRIDQIN